MNNQSTDDDVIVVRSTLSEHPDEPSVTFCRRCHYEVDAGEETATEALGLVHAACLPVPPACPEGVEPELWADGVRLLPHPQHETVIAWELRLRLYVQLFGPAFERQKAARKGATR